jgi:hypothetical protein
MRTFTTGLLRLDPPLPPPFGASASRAGNVGTECGASAPRRDRLYLSAMLARTIVDCQHLYGAVAISGQRDSQRFATAHSTALTLVLRATSQPLRTEFQLGRDPMSLVPGCGVWNALFGGSRRLAQATDHLRNKLCADFLPTRRSTIAYHSGTRRGIEVATETASCSTVACGRHHGPHRAVTTFNQGVVGSNPTRPTTTRCCGRLSGPVL